MTASTYIGLVVAMLQLLPSYSPNVYSRIIFALAMTIEFVSMIIYHYSFQVTADIALWFINLNYKQTNRFVVCLAFGLVCAFGMGLPLIVFTYNPACDKLLNVLYTLGGGGEQQRGVTTLLSANLNQNKHAMSGDAKRTKRSNNKSEKENCSFGENEPPPKRKCKSVDDRHTCGPCTARV